MIYIDIELGINRHCTVCQTTSDRVACFTISRQPAIKICICQTCLETGLAGVKSIEYLNAKDPDLK